MHSRGAAMGDAGIAAATGNQLLGYNVGKTVFTNYFHQASVTYLPWMRNLFQDTKFIRADYLSTIGESATIGAAINFLDMGNLTTRDDNGASLAIHRNTAFSVGGSVGVRLSANAGIGATLRLVGARGFESGPVQRYGVNGDIQFYQSLGKFSVGAVVNNLGKALWQNSEIGLGFAYGDRDEVKEWMIGFDLRKSFSGSFATMRYSLGGEMGFSESFFIRTGVQLEGMQGGNRKSISLGAGYKGFVEDQSLSIDLHYLIPFGTQAAFAPMQNAYGLSLNLNLGNFQ
ncbi:MAG TPA: hypothetical protein DHW64_12560 [Chitinophagaceae bacterium]|nr:hypothetical protein [Chitinophagaceae bacterium]